MNFARDVVGAASRERAALVELALDGSRRSWSFGDVADASARLAGALQREGVGRGDVVLTLVGNRSEWVLTMVACFHIGAVVLPCTEQLRGKDLRLRLDVAQPRLIVADERNRGTLEAALALGGSTARPTVRWIPDPDLFAGPPAEAVELEPSDPALITFTSGTTGTPKAIVHGQRYLAGQSLQAEHWLGAGRDDLVWCTASTGWSKSARNAFIAPWLRGAAALLHDGRFDPAQRLEIVTRERVTILCMAPTEYRVIAKRTTLAPIPGLRGLVAAGEALNPEVLEAFQVGMGLAIRDGFGQTETGQLTGVPPGGQVRAGSMGRALPGVELWLDDGELVVDPATVPTFFVGYHDAPSPAGPWRTGDRVTQDEDGFLYFEARTDDVIISSGYRIGPFEVESALVSHDAVVEAAVVAAPDDERGSVVRAVVVLRDGFEGSDALVRALQDHVKEQTAPYKYPRVVEFVAELPKTASGKIRRAALREG